MTRRELILEEMLSLLNTGNPGAVPDTIRWRGFAQPKEEPLSSSLRPFKEEIERGPGPRGAGVVTRKLVVAIAIRAQGTAVAKPDEVIDPVLEWITSRLNGSRLGGLAMEAIEAEIQWEGAQEDRAYVMATVYVVVRYLTLLADATAAP